MVGTKAKDKKRIAMHRNALLNSTIDIFNFFIRLILHWKKSRQIKNC
jgi:hypothetical protein